MKKAMFLLIAVIFCVGLVYAAPTDDQIRQAANTLGVPFSDLKDFVQSYQPQNVPSGTITATSQDLMAAYRSNQIKADSQYKNKTVKVTGKIAGIKQDYKGNYYVQLEGQSIYTVDVYIKSTEAGKVANLDKGQTVSFIGTCNGYSIASVDIKDATLSM